jgi:ubiquinone/menaquinone biosynthesis C-methylase UbiE
MKHDIEWNTDLWNKTAYIPNNGEGWSEEFGGSEAQWHNIILPRIRKCVPSHSILEIACGWGRWTRFLLRESHIYYGYDISKPAVDHCKNIYEFETLNNKANFILNDGRSLREVKDSSIDFVFSYDSLVHVNMDAIEGYLSEINRVLTDKGKAFIHHSNMGDYGEQEYNPHGRSPFVNSESVKESSYKNNLKVICQEKLAWKSETLNDCYTLLSKSFIKQEEQIVNMEFDKETLRCKNFSNFYTF